MRQVVRVDNAKDRTTSSSPGAVLIAKQRGYRTSRKASARAMLTAKRKHVFQSYPYRARFLKGASPPPRSPLAKGGFRGVTPQRFVDQATSKAKPSLSERGCHAYCKAEACSIAHIAATPCLLTGASRIDFSDLDNHHLGRSHDGRATTQLWNKDE